MVIKSINELMQNSFVISINDKRYFEFCNIFKQHKLNTPLPNLFKGFTIKNGINSFAGFIKTNNVINCTLSHEALIKYGQMLDIPYLCVFEDDAFPCKDICYKLLNTLNALPDDCDMLKLGVIKFESQFTQIVNNYICINNNTWGSHAYIIFKKYYDKYIQNIEQNPVADLLAMNDNTAQIYCVIKPLFIQNIFDGLHASNPYDEQIQSYSKDWIIQNFDITI